MQSVHVKYSMSIIRFSQFVINACDKHVAYCLWHIINVKLWTYPLSAKMRCAPAFICC